MPAIAVTVLAWIFGAGVIPFIVRNVLRLLCGYATWSGFKVFVMPAFFSTAYVVALFNGLPDAVIYLLRLVAFDQALPLLISAYVAAFVMNKVAKACSSMFGS